MSSFQALKDILGPEACKQMIREQDVAEWEGENGLFVAEEDLPMKCEGNPFDDIPQPFDPYGCANPVSGDEE